MACIISATSPDNPGALCPFIFFSTALTSAILVQSAGLFLTSANMLSSFSSWVSPCTPSKSLWSLYHLQSLSLVLLLYIFTQLYPVFLWPSALPFEKKNRNVGDAHPYTSGWRSRRRHKIAKGTVAFAKAKFVFTPTTATASIRTCIS